LGCAQVTSLNLQKHEFGKIPTKIIWMQIAGLTTEHISMLKFSYPSRANETAFERSLCLGSAWEYNLFKLRPTAYSGFLSQITGKKNIKNKCTDYDKKPIWSYLTNQNYKAGIFEGEMKLKDSLLSSKQCKDQSSYLSDTVVWSMNKKQKNGNDFHASDKKMYSKGKVYFDKSCVGKNCFSTLSSNVETTFKNFTKNSKNYIYIMRNFNFANLIKNNKIKEAREELHQINKVLTYFQKKASRSSDTLVLLTTAASYGVDFPRAGRQWRSYEKSGKFLKTRNTKLIASVFASGARAENFCGIYDQSQIMTRIFSGAKQQGLEFSIINPFE
jgi:hypothetical protein